MYHRAFDPVNTILRRSRKLVITTGINRLQTRMSTSTTPSEADTALLVDGLNRLQVDDATSSKPGILDEIHEAGFRIFTSILDLGYFGWRPAGKYRKLEMATVDDILAHIKKNGQPEKLANLQNIQQQLPLEFASPPAQTYTNKYPHDMPHVVSLHMVAKYHGEAVNFKDLDFVFGGSALEVLATSIVPKGTQYVVCQVPHTTVIIVKKYKVYESNLADVGFQFERLVTGKDMKDRHDTQQVEHLQVVQVQDYRVLFSAEVDAVDPSNNSAVEIKASHPKNWGTKTMFQMISSGSCKLCTGTKGKGGKTLTGIKLQSLRKVAARALRSKDHANALEANILANMAAIKREIKEYPPGQVLKIRFLREENATLKLVPTRGVDLLPSEEVIEKLVAVVSV